MEQELALNKEKLWFLHIDEEELKKSEGDFRLLANAIPQIVWTGLPNGEIDYYNRRLYDFTGFTSKELLQYEWWKKILHPDDRTRTLKTWLRSMKTGEIYEIEYRIWDRFNQRYRWFLTRAYPVYNLQGKIIKWLGISTDIDNRKRAEEQLLFHASLAQSITDAVMATNMESIILSWNSAAEALYGWKEAEVRGKAFDDVLHTQYPGQSEAEWTDDLIARGSWRGEVRQQKRDGTWMDIQAGVSVVHDSTGRKVGLVGVTRDITRAKQIERELREHEELLEAAIEMAQLGLWKLTFGTNQIEFSERSKAHLGYAADVEITYDKIGERLLSASVGGKKVKPGAGRLVQTMVKGLRETGEYNAEYRFQWPDGSMHWIEVSGRGQYDHNGKPIGIIGVTRDITERKLEGQRKDTFIGMATHELKTPLTTIKGFTQLLKRQLKKLGMDEQMGTLIRVEEQANALTRLVNELMDATKVEAGKMEYIQEEVDIDGLIRDVVEMLQLTSSQHTLNIHGETRSKMVGDWARLEQVFTNLITNAIKYSPQATEVDIWLEHKPGRLVIKVRDYGLGIPARDLGNIFEHFYRAESVKSRAIRGLGMGLYIAQDIVKHHGGNINVESQEGKGSTFTVVLPLPPTSEQQAISGDSSSGGGETRNDKSRDARGQPG